MARNNLIDGFAVAESKTKNIDRRLIDEMLSTVNILEVLEQQYDLSFIPQPNGEFRTWCPFPWHEDKTPSFDVNPEKGIFNCFGCSTGGSILTFMMKMEGMSFPDALQRLMELSGITEMSQDDLARRAVRAIAEITREYISGQETFPLPAGMSDVQFLRTMAQRLRKYESLTNRDSEELAWVEEVYHQMDNLDASQNYKGLCTLWTRIGKELPGRLSAYRRTQAQSPSI